MPTPVSSLRLTKHHPRPFGNGDHHSLSKYFNQERQKTNAESLIGQHGLVVEDIDTLQAKGVVEVKGLEWSAKTDEPDGKIPKNTVVVIDGIQGVNLIVRAREEKTC